MKRLLTVSDQLHSGGRIPLRRIAFETCQVLLGGVALLCKPSDLSSNEFHAAVNSLHDSIPALRESASKLLDLCLTLSQTGQVLSVGDDSDATQQLPSHRKGVPTPPAGGVVVDCLLGS